MLSTASQLLKYAGNINPVTFITGMRWGTNLLQMYNNMTFAYDPNWKSGETEEVSMPIAFFFIKDAETIMEADVHSKPMLFYNAGTDNQQTANGGLLSIVADNIVTKPKTYKYNILIPFNTTDFLNHYAFDTNSITNVASFTVGNEHSTNFPLLSQINNYVTVGLDLLKNLITALFGTTLDVSSFCNLLLNQNDVNKRSLESMRDARRIIKIKDWNGWKFKYLIIQNLTITKTGENANFYEASLTCQEVPIITLNATRGKKVKYNTVVTATKQLICSKFIKGQEANSGS